MPLTRAPHRHTAPSHGCRLNFTREHPTPLERREADEELDSHCQRAQGTPGPSPPIQGLGLALGLEFLLTGDQHQSSKGLIRSDLVYCVPDSALSP